MRVLRDVVVERAVRNELVVLGRHAAVVGKALKMELGESRRAISVRVTDSRPIVAEGTVRHRISLLPTITTGDLDGLLSDTAPPQDVLAVLSSETPVRVVNCSASGCLLATPVAVGSGTIGSLRLTLDTSEFADDLQVVRCLPIEGSSTFHVGGQFLWTAPPGQESFRLGISRMHAHPA